MKQKVSAAATVQERADMTGTAVLTTDLLLIMTEVLLVKMICIFKYPVFNTTVIYKEQQITEA